MSGETIVAASVGFVNLSPDAFHRWATHYYQCRKDFNPPEGMSPVPYFLLCRAIELELKAKHLVEKRQHQVKADYGHNLVRSYDGLSDDHKKLNEDELEVLSSANSVYAAKGFEYFNPEDALTGFSRFPDLEALDSVAKKLIYE